MSYQPPAADRRGSTRSVSLLGVLAALPAIVWEADGRDFMMTLVSPRARDLLGHEPEDWIGVPTFWENHLHPDDRDRAVHEVEAALRARTAGEVEYRFRHADGSYRWFRDTFSVVEDEQGNLRLTGLMLDINEEHAARAAQAAAEAERDRLIEAVEQSAESIFISDVDGRLVFVNAGFERNSGYRREEVLGRVPDFLPAMAPGDPPFEMVAEQVNQAGFWAGDIVNRRKDGTEYREALTITAVRDRDGKIIGRVGAARDITREREVEAQLAQASRMEAIGQLAGGVAHDFNNLLTAILGYGSMLADALEPDSPEAADLSEILGAARRAQSLTSQLLAFGRRTLLQPRIVDPAELVRRLAPMLERLIGEDVELSVAAHSGRSVRIDPGQLDQAVVNLVVNARDAMPAGGTVTVAVRPATSADLPSERAIPSSSPDDVAATVGTRPEDWVVVEVADSGVGMTDTVRARAFEPFFTTKPIGKGTGLGLAMVEGFMRQSGGFVAVTTAPGQGTRVALILPGADDRAAPARDEPGPSPGVAASRTVLVVEDEPAIRRLASRALRDAGHTVLEAGSGEAALAMAESHVGPIDVLFTDIVMPGMSGPTLAAELARRYPGLRVVLTSGYAESEVARRGVAVGANGFLRKPYSAGELRAALAASA